MVIWLAPLQEHGIVKIETVGKTFMAAGLGDHSKSVKHNNQTSQKTGGKAVKCSLGHKGTIYIYYTSIYIHYIFVTFVYTRLYISCTGLEFAKNSREMDGHG